MKYLLTVLSFIFLSTSISYSFDVDKQLQSLIQIESQIPQKQTVYNLSSTAKIKQEISDIRDEAIQQQKLFEANIEENKQLLNTLTIDGDETDLSKEDQTLLTQKNLIQTDLAKASASLKKARLLEAQSNKLLSQISSLNADTFSDFLFKKFEFPLTGKSLSNLQSEWQIVKQNTSYNTWLKLIAVIAFFNSAILLFGKRIYAFYLNQPVSKVGNIKLYKYRIATIFTLITVAYCLYFIFGTEEQSPYLVSTTLFVCYLIAAPFLYKLLGKIDLSPTTEEIDEEVVVKEHKFLKFVVSIAKLALIAAPILMVMGYMILGSYIIFNIALTASAVVLFIFLRKIAERIIFHFKSDDNTISALSIVVIEVIIGIFLFVLVSNFWGFSLQSYADLYESYKNGITIGNNKFYIQSIVFAIIGFFVALYIFRFVQWFFKERILKHTKTKKGAANAITSIIGYIGITIAIVTALSILGLETEDLALVVGALSLGIGFGLQNVINNFVSGLILLFERPVKIGDWIILDSGVEGHIKRIRIRSTELETLQRASVIIPNSDLISKSITNWTLRDPIGRIDIAVGVAYGSDTQKVKQALLDVAAKHSGVRKSPMPRVLFREFGDSSLNLELRCFVKNIDEKMFTASDLHFAVDEAFRANNIEIPFPQRDLHIKSGSLEGGKKTKKKV